MTQYIILVLINKWIRDLAAMGKLSSKLRKKENNTDISLYQIYLLKLHENILEYYTLNSFKKSLLDSTTVYRQIRNRLQVRGSLNKFPDFFRIGTFIDSTHMKL